MFLTYWVSFGLRIVLLFLSSWGSWMWMPLWLSGVWESWAPFLGIVVPQVQVHAGCFGGFMFVTLGFNVINGY
jgi:hypothetical protein